MPSAEVTKRDSEARVVISGPVFQANSQPKMDCRRQVRTWPFASLRKAPGQVFVFGVQLPLCHDPSHGGSYVVKGCLLIRIGLCPCIVSEDLPRIVVLWSSCIISYIPVGCVSCVPPSCRCLCTILVTLSPSICLT